MATEPEEKSTQPRTPETPLYLQGHNLPKSSASDGTIEHWHAEILEKESSAPRRYAFLTSTEACLYLASHAVRLKCENRGPGSPLLDEAFGFTVRDIFERLPICDELSIEQGIWRFNTRRCATRSCNHSLPDHPDYRCPLCHGNGKVRNAWDAYLPCEACQTTGMAYMCEWIPRAQYCGWR